MAGDQKANTFASVSRSFVIGTVISYAQRYHAHAGKRFRRVQKGLGFTYELYPESAAGKLINGNAYVTGWAYRVMSGYWVDACEEYYTAGGTKEVVLLCREKPSGREFVVRIEDATKVVPE